MYEYSYSNLKVPIVCYNTANTSTYKSHQWKRCFAIFCYLDLLAVGCCVLFSFDAAVDVTGSELTTVGDTSFIVEKGQVSILDNEDDHTSYSYSDTSSDSDDPTLYIAICFVFSF